MFTFNGAIMNSAGLQEIVEQARRDSLTPVRGAEPDFGDKLRDAVKRRLSATRAQANVSADGEDFGERLKKAVQQHPKSKKQAQKNAEKDRARYTFKPRPRTKGE
jgi:flagellar hook-basal body complex protein FliE